MLRLPISALRRQYFPKLLSILLQQQHKKESINTIMCKHMSLFILTQLQHMCFHLPH